MMWCVVNYDPVIKLIHMQIYVNTIIYIVAGIAQLV